MRGGLAWLGAQTGPLRDLDVLLAHCGRIRRRR
jgi:hypothetical protein